MDSDMQDGEMFFNMESELATEKKYKKLKD